jgi:hypothetical protein
MHTSTPDPIASSVSFDEADLKEKIHELEAQLSQIQAKREAQQGYMYFLGGQKWKALLFILPLMFFSFLPSLLVVQDRWLQVEKMMNYSRATLCKVEFLCKTAMPGYFPWIVMCVAFVFILTLVFAHTYQGKIKPVFSREDSLLVTIPREQSGFRLRLMILALLAMAVEIGISFFFNRVPGAELLLVVVIYWAALWLGEKKFAPPSLPAWLVLFKQKAPRVATIIFSQTVLLLFLREATAPGHRIGWSYILLLLIAVLAVIWQFKNLGKIYWVFTLGLLLFTFQMNSWKFSKIGDEYSFFSFPVSVIAHQSPLQIVDMFLNQQAVYGKFAYFSSFVQYLFMVFLGYDHFGWHISNIYLVLLSIPLLYNFFKTFVNEKVAFYTVVLVALSSYLISFSKIGYNNLQSFFFAALVLWVAGKAVKVRSLGVYFLLGITMGGLFYTFPAALYLLPVPWLLLVLYDPPRSRVALLRYGHALLGLVIMMTPLFFQPYYWGNMADGTVYNQPEQAKSLEYLSFHFGSNILYSLFNYLYIPREAHYVVASLVDPLTAGLLVPGLALVVVNLKRNRFMFFLAGAYFFLLLSIGSTHYFDFPPTSRMFLVLPWYFVLAAFGLDWLVRLVSGTLSRPGRSYRNIVIGVLVGVACLSLIQTTRIFDLRYKVQHFEPVVLHLLQKDARHVADYPLEFKNYLFLTDQYYGLEWLYTIQDVYKVPESKAQFLRLIVDPAQIPDAWLKRIKEEENLIVIVPSFLPEEIRGSLSQILEQQEKIPCDLRYYPGGDVQLQMWVSPRYQNLCVEVQTD